MLGDYRQHVNALNSEAQRNLEAMRTIEEQKRQLTMSTDEKIRALRQSAMGEYQAYQDKLKQLDELTSKGRQALAVGDSQLAEEYFRKVIENASSAARAVTVDGKEMVTQQQAVATAIQKITEAEQLAQQPCPLAKPRSAGTQAHRQGAESCRDIGTLAAQWQEVSSSLAGVNLTITPRGASRGDRRSGHVYPAARVLLNIKSNVDELQEKVKEMQSKRKLGRPPSTYRTTRPGQSRLTPGRPDHEQHALHPRIHHPSQRYRRWADNGPVRMAGVGLYGNGSGVGSRPGHATSNSVRAMLTARIRSAVGRCDHAPGHAWISGAVQRHLSQQLADLMRRYPHVRSPQFISPPAAVFPVGLGRANCHGRA
jgi:hypothetical protein